MSEKIFALIHLLATHPERTLFVTCVVLGLSMTTLTRMNWNKWPKAVIFMLMFTLLVSIVSFAFTISAVMIGLARDVREMVSYPPAGNELIKDCAKTLIALVPLLFSERPNRLRNLNATTENGIMPKP